LVISSFERQGESRDGVLGRHGKLPDATYA
jgi:hypothetical protein